ncbi:transferase [Cytophagaceae bacterium ABcell3]|nr:transferase [Cytophagaceae bacterium ABcell3]
MHILFPGRHHLLTDFQFKYLFRLINGGLKKEVDVYGKALDIEEPIESIFFAVTSSNHSNTRRNPLPFYLRAVAIESFASGLGVPCFTFGIEDVGLVEDFAGYTIKKIQHETDGKICLTPKNTVVICSTPVFKMYDDKGFRMLPGELQDISTWTCHTEQPWSLVEKIAASTSWKEEVAVLDKMHPASYNVWNRYDFGDKVKLLFNDKIIGDDGDITETRDYNSYVRQMDEIAELKYRETAPYVKPGRVGDIGCAVGSWIKLACQDPVLRESDFYGIEVSRRLFDICQQRKHNHEFENPYVFFSQKNAVTGLVFEPGSMNSIFTSSLTHEIESYGSREDLIAFINNRFEELVPEGVWVNRDVVGAEHKDKEVFMLLNKQDGLNDLLQIPSEDLNGYLKNLSTYGRFLQFAKDFRQTEGYVLRYEEQEIEGKVFVKLKLQDAMEFITKKDYIDNWQSEMYETFCFWSFSDWKEHLEKAGFSISPQSNAYTNPWLVENRFKGKAELFELVNKQLVPLDYPVTNMILIAEKKV